MDISDGRSALVAAMGARMGGIVDDIGEMVRCESPSSVPSAVALSADLVAAVGERHLAAAPELLVVDGSTHVRWRFGHDKPRVLLLAHHDTVWPLGSLETHPFSVADGVLRGPGCVDMKAGLVLAFHALAVLGLSHGGVPAGVTL